MALNENKLELNPTLEINKNKEFENIDSIIIEKIKVSRDSTLTIVNNSNISQEQKVLLLQQQNSSLIDTLYELKNEIEKIKDDMSYSEYRIFKPTPEFDLELVKNQVKFTTWTTPIKDLAISRREIGINTATVYESIRFYEIHYKDIEKFINIAKKLGILIK